MNPEFVKRINEIDLVISSYFPEIKDDSDKKAEFILAILEFDFANDHVTTETYSPLTIERKTEYFRMQNSLGLGGGKSFKVQNIFVNWKKILKDNFLEGVTGILGSMGHPYIVILSVLVIAKNIYKETKIEIDERHSIVLVELWKLSNNGTCNISGKTILDILNSLLVSLDKGKLTQSELDIILDDLNKLKSLTYNSDGTISIVEKVTFQ